MTVTPDIVPPEEQMEEDYQMEEVEDYDKK